MNRFFYYKNNVLFDLLHPIIKVLERFLVRDVKYEHDAVGSSKAIERKLLVVVGSDGPESLLTGGVPDLQFALLAVYRHVLGFLAYLKKLRNQPQWCCKRLMKICPTQNA